jgi:hypothetical protein
VRPYFPYLLFFEHFSHFQIRYYAIGATTIALLIAFAIAAHKYARVAVLAFGASGQRAAFWEQCDLFNAHHYSKSNAPLMRSRTPFGGMMASIFIVTFCMTAAMLILNNVLYPSYDLSGTRKMRPKLSVIIIYFASNIERLLFHTRVKRLLYRENSRLTFYFEYSSRLSRRPTQFR